MVALVGWTPLKSHFGSSIIALHAQPWPCKPRCSLSHVLSLVACGRRFEMMPMPVAVKAEFMYVVLVAGSMLEQFYVRFVHRLFLHWHPRAMRLFPALCSSRRSLPMLHCRSWCCCSASSCCRPLGFRRLGAHRVALVSLCRSGADTCREVVRCGCEEAEPTTSFFVGSSTLAVRWRGA